MAGLDDLSFLPLDEEELTPVADLDAAEAGALEDPLVVPVEEDAPEPFGRTWYFDWAVGRFRRHGLAPAETRGDGALRQWCLMAAYSAWGAHGVFSAEFGVDRPDSVIGLVGSDALAEASDWAVRLRDAWLVHDRIAEVEDLDPQLMGDAIFIPAFEVVTDEDDHVVIGPLTLRAPDPEVLREYSLYGLEGVEAYEDAGGADPEDLAEVRLMPNGDVQLVTLDDEEPA